MALLSRRSHRAVFDFIVNVYRFQIEYKGSVMSRLTMCLRLTLTLNIALRMVLFGNHRNVTKIPYVSAIIMPNTKAGDNMHLVI